MMPTDYPVGGSAYATYSSAGATYHCVNPYVSGSTSMLGTGGGGGAYSAAMSSGYGTTAGASCYTMAAAPIAGQHLLLDKVNGKDW